MSSGLHNGLRNSIKRHRRSLRTTKSGRRSPTRQSNLMQWLFQGSSCKQSSRAHPSNGVALKRNHALVTLDPLASLYTPLRCLVIPYNTSTRTGSLKTNLMSVAGLQRHCGSPTQLLIMPRNCRSSSISRNTPSNTARSIGPWKGIGRSTRCRRNMQLRN